jgi:predicted HTH transcriptional regulator
MITVAKMVDMLGLPRTAIERAIKQLKEKNIILREGSTKKGKWVVLK